MVAHSLGECEGVSFRNKVKVAINMDENAVAAWVISACNARVHAFHTRTRFRLGALQVTTMQRYKLKKCAALVPLCHSTHQKCGCWISTLATASQAGKMNVSPPMIPTCGVLGEVVQSHQSCIKYSLLGCPRYKAG